MANLPGATIVHSKEGITSSGPFQHMDLRTQVDSKVIKLNSRNYSQATGDSIGFQSKVNQDTTSTGEVYGGQVQPRVASAISVASCTSLQLDSELKGTGATTATADLRNLNTYLGAAAAAHVIGGDAVTIRSRCEVSTNPTGDITWAKILNHEGSQGWDSFVKFVSSGDGAVALGTHSMTTASDKTGNAKSGTIKVLANGALYHIQLYAD